MEAAMTPIRTTLVAAAITAALAAPAAAGGSVSLSFNPQNQQQTRLLQSGLAIYAITQDIKGSASVRQKGKNNNGAVVQNGGGNLGIVHQEGRGHSGTVEQAGNGNAYGVFQFGKRTDAAVTQRGNGNAGALFQWGW
jgi:minor curlin subunit